MFFTVHKPNRMLGLIMMMMFIQLPHLVATLKPIDWPIYMAISEYFHQHSEMKCGICYNISPKWFY